MAHQQGKKSDISLLSGILMITVMPIMVAPGFLTGLVALGGIGIFVVGLIYALSGGRRLFTAAYHRWPRVCYYMAAIGWMPYVFAAVLLAALGGAWYWPAVNEWDMNVVTTVANTAAVVWVTAGVVSLYRAWRYRKKDRVLYALIRKNKRASALKKQRPLRQRIFKAFLILLGMGTGAILLFVLLVVIYYFIDRPGHCYSDGFVWDYDEGRCRMDCLAWIKGRGCLVLTPDQVALEAACVAHSVPYRGVPQVPCDRDAWRRMHMVLCQQYKGVWDEEAGACDYWKRSN